MGGGGVVGDRGGAAVPRREFAGAPYLAAQAPFRARVGSTRSWGAHEQA
jgi:hypothetical protein